MDMKALTPHVSTNMQHVLAIVKQDRNNLAPGRQEYTVHGENVTIPTNNIYTVPHFLE